MTTGHRIAYYGSPVVSVRRGGKRAAAEPSSFELHGALDPKEKRSAVPAIEVQLRDHRPLPTELVNTHCEKSLLDAFGAFEGRRLWRRFTVHHTPKHASWLNPAEIEVSLWSRECLGSDRVATFEELSRRTRAWNSRANSSRRRINWRFTTADARRVFRYERSAMHGARHYPGFPR